MKRKFYADHESGGKMDSESTKKTSGKLRTLKPLKQGHENSFSFKLEEKSTYSFLRTGIGR